MNTALIKKTLATLGIASLGLMAGGAQADWHRDDPGHRSNVQQQSVLYSQQISGRQHQQIKRIQSGQREGSLTRFEFRNLMHEQREIRAMERNFLADGFIDEREFSRLDHALDISSQNIRKELHDNQARYADNRRHD